VPETVLANPETNEGTVVAVVVPVEELGGVGDKIGKPSWARSALRPKAFPKLFTVVLNPETAWPNPLVNGAITGLFKGLLAPLVRSGRDPAAWAKAVGCSPLTAMPVGVDAVRKPDTTGVELPMSAGVSPSVVAGAGAPEGVVTGVVNGKAGLAMAEAA
jgi:hypothetical protein